MSTKSPTSTQLIAPKTLAHLGGRDSRPEGGRVKKLTPAKPRKPRPVVADIAAPVTITITGRLAAVLRFSAYLNGRTPEEEAMDSIRTDVAAGLVNGFGHTDDSADKWLQDSAA